MFYEITFNSKWSVFLVLFLIILLKFLLKILSTRFFRINSGQINQILYCAFYLFLNVSFLIMSQYSTLWSSFLFLCYYLLQMNEYMNKIVFSSTWAGGTKSKDTRQTTK